jgi:polyisoprenoid-binding protein YceI
MAWEIDATHSHARFSIRQMGAGAIQGQFKAMSGYVYVDEST